MKLIEIEDIKVGQIWENKNDNSLSFVEGLKDELAFTLLYIQIFDKSDNKLKLNTNIDVFNFRKDNILIGMDNITHKLENNKLVEIPREEFEVDDIYLQHWEEWVDTDSRSGIIHDERELILNRIDEDNLIFNNCLDITEIVILDKETVREKSGIYKIGIYGITHEFVNDKLIKE